LEKLLDQILPERLRLKLTVPTTFVLVDESSPTGRGGTWPHVPTSEAELPATDFGLGRGLRGYAPVRRYNVSPTCGCGTVINAVFMFVRRDGFDGKTLWLTPSYISYLIRMVCPRCPRGSSGILAQYEHVTYEEGNPARAN
jgi:hypothetical protein